MKFYYILGIVVVVNWRKFDFIVLNYNLIRYKWSLNIIRVSGWVVFCRLCWGLSIVIRFVFLVVIDFM